MSKGLGKREREILDRLSKSEKPLTIFDLLGLSRSESAKLMDNWRTPVHYNTTLHAVRSLERKGFVVSVRYFNGRKRKGIGLIKLPDNFVR